MKSGTMMAYISRMCSQFSHFPRKICSKLYIHVCFLFSNISEEFIRRFIYVFFLQNTIDFRFVQGLGQQKMSGSVSDVVITSASFDKERRASTKSRVKLYSFYLSVQYIDQRRDNVARGVNLPFGAPGLESQVTIVNGELPAGIFNLDGETFN